MDCIGGKIKCKPKSVFVFIFGLMTVWMMYLFFWITTQRHIRVEGILSMLVFVCSFVGLFVCLLIITCVGRKRKLNFYYSFKHTQHVILSKHITHKRITQYTQYIHNHTPIHNPQAGGSQHCLQERNGLCSNTQASALGNRNRASVS